MHPKDQITLPNVWEILVNLWVPYEIESLNFQQMFGLQISAKIFQTVGKVIWPFFKNFDFSNVLRLIGLNTYLVRYFG